jgi:hypothetical protein
MKEMTSFYAVRQEVPMGWFLTLSILLKGGVSCRNNAVGKEVSLSKFRFPAILFYFCSSSLHGLRIKPVSLQSLGEIYVYSKLLAFLTNGTKQN